MRFGKIEYLNLLPFDVFIKSYPLSNAQKLAISKRQSYPSKLNADFKKRRIDAGFISSIAGIKNHYSHKATMSGIIARGEVWSVLVKQNCQNLSDYQSASSNALAQILNLKGEVLIGDRALHFMLSGGAHIDLGREWKRRFGLPFVFGRLCFHKDGDLVNRISKAFNKKCAAKRKKIPHYILQATSARLQIDKRDILAYLEHIFYKIGAKELRAIEVFYNKARVKGLV